MSEILQGLPFLGQPEFGDEEAAMIIGIVGAALAIGCVVGLVIKCVILYLVHNAYKVVPAEFRMLEPGHIWLLLIPCFPVVWNFFVYQRIPESFRRCLEARGQTQYGDCGQQLGLALSVCACCSIVPYIGGLFAIAHLVLLIVLIVKMYELKRVVEQGNTMQEAGGYNAGFDPSNPYTAPGKPPLGPDGF